MGAEAALNGGRRRGRRRPPRAQPRGSGATTISVRLRSIASAVARPTRSGVTVPTHGGSRTPASAYMPASRTKPGDTTETPTPAARRSSRSASAKPRRPNFVAA